MRYLAIARFRLWTIVRTGTPMFIAGMVPPLLALLFVGGLTEPMYRDAAFALLDMHARVAVMSWVFHTLFLTFATLMSGKTKSVHDDMTIATAPDLMDTAPAGPRARFAGEWLGTFAAAMSVHLCCLPVLAAVAALDPLPNVVFVSIESVAVALMILAAAGAAWLRRAPRTKYSATRGPRNAAVVFFLFLFVLGLTTRWRELRDALVAFLYPHTSPVGWAAVVEKVDNPPLLIALLLLLYFGTIAYYYTSATRRRVVEN